MRAGPQEKKSTEEVEDARFPPPPRACPRVRERGRRGRGKEGTRGSSRDGNNFRCEKGCACMHALKRQDREVVDFMRYRVKNYSELTNFRKLTQIEWHNGKYGSNPQGIKEFLDVILEFDQIGREIDGRNWGKYIL